MSLRVARDDVKWTSLRCEGAPHRWGELDPEGQVLSLKSTCKPYWNNRLVSPSRFVYSFPSNPKADWEHALVSRVTARIATHVPLEVHLFVTPGSRNEFYGQWAVEEWKATTSRPGVSELHLRRLASQSVVVQARYCGRVRAERSANEADHHRLLLQEFPANQGWTVRHEPETLLDLHSPSVVDGQRVVENERMTRSYTCDFVVARGAVRFCIESKPCASHVTRDAIAKCRVLRDTTLTRVLFMVGNITESVQWVDVGPIGHDNVHWGNRVVVEETADGWFVA